MAGPITCRACCKVLLPENETVADGCPCNSARGINHGYVRPEVCTCIVCDPAQTGSSRVRPPTGLFHVETLGERGTWSTFTVEPLRGREAAEEHLAIVHRHLTDPTRARLHEVTEDEQRKALVVAAMKALSKDDRERIVREHVAASVAKTLSPSRQDPPPK